MSLSDNPGRMEIALPTEDGITTVTLDPELGWMGDDPVMLGFLNSFYPYPPKRRTYYDYIPYPVDYLGNEVAIKLKGTVVYKPVHPKADPSILF